MHKTLYIDYNLATLAKIGGATKMQKALLDKTIKCGLYASEKDADVLVYIQIPFDDKIVNTWKKYKEQGKKIVFIHHYLWKELYKNYAIFKVKGLLELIDLHIIMSKNSDIYKDLSALNCNVVTYEQASADYIHIYNNYWTNWCDKIENSICFVGRVKKGLYEFLEYTSQSKFKNWTKIILCDKEFDTTTLDDTYITYFGKTDDNLYVEVAKCQFLYLNTDLMQAPTHLETVVHEAIPCGTVIIHGDKIRRYFTANDTVTGFVKDITTNDCSINQIKQLQFLISNYDDINTVITKNIFNALLV